MKYSFVDWDATSFACETIQVPLAVKSTKHFLPEENAPQLAF